MTPEIVVTHPSDPRLARRDWVEAGYEQSAPFDGEPIFVVIPATASDGRLAAMGRQFGIAFELLGAFRRDLRTASVLRVLGREMAPRFREGAVITTKPIGDRAELVMDLEIVVRLRSGHALLRQVNAVTETSIELVDCWRADRVQVNWSDVERIDRVAYCEDNSDDEPLGCGTVDAHIPGWLRHKQIGRPFLGPDRSRDPWSEDEAGETSAVLDPLAA